MHRGLAFTMLLALAAAPAAAADWAMQPGSWLEFETSYDGEAFAGRFGRFAPMLRFDPATLDDARFDVRIDLASAGTGLEERDEMLAGDEFLAAGTVGEARYVATRFRALGGDRFVADGELTLRGVTRPVALAFTWRGTDRPVLDGEATVPRLAFGVGTGDWADTALLPDAVKVRTHLELAAGSGSAAAGDQDAEAPPGPAQNARTSAAVKGQSSSAAESSRLRTGIRAP